MGALGRIELQAGTWLYVGSARGPGGLAARVGRHWRDGVPKHWHMDYLKPLREFRDRIFVTGKYWPELFEISLIPPED